MLRAALQKILDGLLIGIGVGIVFTAVAVFYERSFEDSQFKSYGSDAKLSIKSHRPQPDSGSVFVGEVVNDGNDTWSHVRVMVKLFDTGGQFVGKCTGHVEGLISPGQTQHFQVSCSKCDEESAPTYDTYTVEVVSASYQDPESEV